MSIPTNQRGKFVYSKHTGDTIDIQGLGIHIVAAGEGDPVLMIHGVGQCAYTWRRNFDALAEHFMVIAVDMVGYGFSDKPDLVYSVEENSEFLLALLNALRIKQAHFVAMGSGAVYVLDFMIHYPERVGKTVCIAPGGMTPHMPASIRMMGSSAVSRLAGMTLGERTIRNLLGECLFDQTCITDEDVETYADNLDSREAKEVLRKSIANFDETDVLEQLRMVEHEILFFWGNDDRWRPVEESEPYVAQIENGRMSVIRNCGHLLHEEKVERFNDEVTRFFLGLEAPEIEE